MPKLRQNFETRIGSKNAPFQVPFQKAFQTSSFLTAENADNVVPAQENPQRNFGGGISNIHFDFRTSTRDASAAPSISQLFDSKRSNKYWPGEECSLMIVSYLRHAQKQLRFKRFSIDILAAIFSCKLFVCETLFPPKVVGGVG